MLKAFNNRPTSTREEVGHRDALHFKKEDIRQPGGNVLGPAGLEQYVHDKRDTDVVGDGEDDGLAVGQLLCLVLCKGETVHAFAQKSFKEYK